MAHRKHNSIKLANPFPPSHMDIEEEPHIDDTVSLKSVRSELVLSIKSVSLNSASEESVNIDERESMDERVSLMSHSSKCLIQPN